VLSDAIKEYLEHVYIGLTGSVTMITCTVLALTRLVFHYKGESDHYLISFWFFWESLLTFSTETVKL